MGDLLGSPRVAPFFLKSCRHAETGDSMGSLRAVPQPPWTRGDFVSLGAHACCVGNSFCRSSADKRIDRGNANGCDHTSTNAPDPIRTPQLSVLGRE